MSTYLMIRPPSRALGGHPWTADELLAVAKAADLADAHEVVRS